jgi:hypothetical protein
MGPFMEIPVWHLVHLPFGIMDGVFSEKEWHFRHEKASIPIP